MKKYFLKSLPTKDTCFVGGQLSEKTENKLFLCSRNIQVGDVMTRKDGTTLTVHNSEEGLEAAKIIIKAEECFNVIGEVSPDALSYVKEGDEFEGNQIRVLFRSKQCTKGYAPVLLKLSEKNLDELMEHWKNVPNYAKGLKNYTDGTKDIISIKGPCGHFH